MIRLGSGRVHASVQHTDDVDARGCLDVEEQVAAYAVPPVPLTDLVAGAPTRGILADALGGSSDLADVLLSPGGVPVLLGVVPDLREVTLRRRCEPKGSHRRLEATNASKSKGTAWPDASPSTMAARSP